MLDRRPYVTYDVVPSKRIVINQYAHGSASGETLYSGTFTAYFKCYSPFGRMTMTAIEPGDTGCYGGTGLLSRTMMPPAPTPSSKSFLVYCPGTERANTLIRLAGDVGDGLTIHNATTGQRCRIDGLRINSLPPGSYISIDSAMGQVLSHKGDDTELAYHFHDLGYVQLAPCLPLVGNVELAHTAGSKEIRSRGAFLSHMTGQYVYLGGWKKIHRIDSADVAHLMTNAETTGASTTPIATMNEVYLEGEGFNLSRFELEYTPRIR